MISDPSLRYGPRERVAVTQPAAEEALEAELRETLEPRIQLLRQLGDGGMGRVYLARDPELRRLVAVKVLATALRDDPIARQRFTREARAAAAVSHPNVVTIHEVGTLPTSGAPYLIMQYVDGQSLLDELPDGHAPEARARRIIGEIASALATAHARGLVHRDITPSNVVIDSESGRTVVLDFGIAAALDASAWGGTTTLTSVGTAIGTPAYMSPEQAAAEPVCPESDVYSLGLVAYELVSGERPFGVRSDLGMIAAHLRERPPSVLTRRPDLSPEFAELIDRCLTKDPGQRPAAAEIARALLPQIEPTIEWPPPGLDELCGRGWRLLTALSGTAIATALFFLALHAQPQASAIGPPRFAGNWAAAGWYDEVTPIWFSFLGTCVAVAAVFAVLACTRGARLAGRLYRGRRMGYPWTVLIDVATDHHGDTIALLNGFGAFALAPRERRERFVRLRRVHVGLLMGALFLALVLPVCWTVGWLGGWLEGAARLLPREEVAVMLFPSLLLMLVAGLVRLPERRARRRPVRPRHFATPARELVGAWLRRAGRAERSRSRTHGKGVAAALPASFVVLAGVTVLPALLLALGVTLLTAGRTSALRGVSAEWVAAVTSDSLDRLDWPALDSLVGAAAATLAAPPRSDTAAARAFVAATLYYWTSSPPTGVDSDTSVSARWRQASLVDTTAVAQAWRSLPGSLPDSLRATLARDTAAPWVAVWRRLARATYDTPLWSLARPFLWSAESRALPLFDYSTVTDAAYRNLAAAALALERGANDAAVRRARETIAVGRHLLRDPLPHNSLIGLSVVEAGRAALAEIGRVSENPRLMEETTTLAMALRRYRGEYSMFSRAVREVVMVDPRALNGLPYIRDTTLAPAVRWRLVQATVEGYCGNGREVLFGIHPARRRAVAIAGELAGDLPGTESWVVFNRRLLETLMQAPEEALRSRPIDRPFYVEMLGWLGLADVRDRLQYCRWQRRI
jgi:hypothetical protein